MRSGQLRRPPNPPRRGAARSRLGALPRARPRAPLLLLLLAAAAACHAAAPQLPPLPLRTSGRSIVDQKGARVRLRCASWSGGQERWFVPSGLWAQPRGTIAALARGAGLNCIRLVWSVEAALRGANGTAAVPDAAVAANPDLKGRGPLEVWDAVIAALANAGLMVVLDNHSSDAMWCCDMKDGNGLWYTDRWSEADWLRAWDLVARRYASTPAVVGMGLRNEPRPAVVGGRIRVPLWGSGGAELDLARAYERAAAAVLSARRGYLILAQAPSAGRDLRAARMRPLTLRAAWPEGALVRNQLVYETHEYPFLYGRTANFTKNYSAYRALLDNSWGYMTELNSTPIWLGEFGTTHDAAGISSSWWKALMAYIRAKDLDWSYWPLDGQQGPSRSQGAEETYGLLNTDWSGYAYPPLVEELRKIS
ncbi:endoglucanase e1 [Raphidocelis subcapitata]|uniref:Endoglucanase e1 n=1 Tax=Raphidocelis subcapitata TaxID=307507 RepID=A0A2V0P9R7_9CHLO|nr:endoglucanase e1 [Raphidocelis subcapitata]|eukprot:GBF94600.1 endoglucanase e1 [Raphidocelis subcapitata]